MRIKFYFFILVLFLFGLGIALVYLVGKMQAMHLYIAEAIIAFILIYLGVFYRKIEDRPYGPEGVHRIL